MRDIKLGETFTFRFSTRAFATGIPTALAGSPVLSYMEDGTDTALTAGLTFAASAVAGLNKGTMVATGGNGIETGKTYDVYLSAGTVAGVSVVGEVVFSFTCESNPVNWAKVTNPTTALDLSGTDIQLADTVTDLTNERGKYSGGMVWIGPSANTNTASYVDGIITNPVSTIAAAKTIADALKLRRFHTVRTGASQIGADMTGYSFDGTDWSVTTTGGSRDLGASHFKDADVIGGTYASTGGSIDWHHCQFTAAVSIGESIAVDCLFKSTLTLTTAGDYDFVDCASAIPGAASPTFALGTGAMNLGFRRWSGGITMTGISTDDVVTLDGSFGGITLSGADGIVDVRGTYKSITDNRTGSPTLTITGSMIPSNVATILTDTTTISNGIIEGTAATGTLSTTQCTSSLTGYTDDQMIGRIITFLAGPADGESSDITDYASASGLITFTAMTLASENGNAFKVT